MTKTVRFSLIIICSIFTFKSAGQINYQSEYLSGKNYFLDGNYQMAKNKFGNILDANEDNPFYLYASYFYGIAAYKTDEVEKAMEQYRRIRNTHPKWDKIDELNIWYGHMLLDQSDLFKGLEVLNGIGKQGLEQRADSVKKMHLVAYDSIPLLQKALELHPYDKVLARHLADVISQKPLTERPIELLEFLVESFDLDKSVYYFIDKEVSQKKERYNVAVMLPFMAESLTTSKGSKANQFVLDLYQGIQLAADELNKKGEKIKLFAYDTKKDSTTTANILTSGELLEMDLVIGPLYPAPVNLMKAYSNEHRINMVNPLSSNSVIIGNNPYSFLLKSTPETRAKAAAEFAKKSFNNKRATIFYGSETEDSIFAHTYRRVLEADSFQISWMERVETPEEATEILRSLTTVYSKKETGRNKGKMVLERSVKVRVDPEDSLYLTKDSLSHIMVASSENLLISNILSAVDTRRDEIPVIGLEDWLDIEQISFEQMERMGIVFIGQNYFDFSSQEVADFKTHYKESFNLLPTRFSYDGYETMRVFGEKLIEYGNYFQYGIYDEGFFPGQLFYGFNYNNANDNQFVPVMRLNQLNIEMINVEENRMSKTK